MPVHAKCKLVKKEQLKDDIFKFGVEVGEELKSCGTIYITDEILKIFEDIIGKENCKI